MKKITQCALLLSVLFSPLSSAQVPTPAESLGFELGQWHVRHDQIDTYFRQLAQSAPEQARLEVIGKTHAQRPVLQLVLSSAKNMARLDQIRQQHLQVVAGTATPDPALPLVIWLGYSVHGNESSAANAAVKLAYHLLSSEDAEVKAWLDQAVILLQPTLNPDGHDRFAIWANMHQGQAAVADPQHREHVEPWPNGRPNHYWFDLNRDWLPLQQPESQARIQQFHYWMPQVVGDFHEMGTNSTYFFQPGIPSRNNPATPEENFRLTALLANYHAKAFDQKGKLYYTEESFDDFYIGKGSTYPDIHGAIGILFEQASSRGHLQESINGPLSFATTIENQFLASLSTLRGAVEHKSELQQWQQQFFKESKQLAQADAVKGYVLEAEQDLTRMQALLNLLAQHQVKVYPIARKDQGGPDYYVPLQQPQYRFIKAAFSTQTNFRDNTFYDVSAWTLPHAYNIRFTESRKIPAGLSQQPWQPTARALTPVVAGAYAYAIRWHDQQAPVFLQHLLSQGVQVRGATRSFSANTATGIQQFAAGTLLIPAGLQQGDWFSRLSQAQQQHGLELISIASGLTPQGQDLGSNLMVPIKLPKVLLLAGPGMNSTEAGELWFNLERLAGISPSLVEPARLARIDLDRYTHILLPDGVYQSLREPEIQKLKHWLEQGGVLWAQKSAVSFLADKGLLQVKVRSAKELSALIRQENIGYGDKEQLAGRQRIAGAIFQAEVDLSHPLTFGLPRAELPVFKNALLVMQKPEQPFVTVATYQKGPQLAGFAAPELTEQISQSAAVVAHNHGAGRIIAMADNPVFRGYFNGSTRLLVNALYYGHAFDASFQETPGEED